MNTYRSAVHVLRLIDLHNGFVKFKFNDNITKNNSKLILIKDSLPVYNTEYIS
jgi:hypothetical protein